MRVQGGFDAVIRRIRRLQKTAIFRVGDGTLNRLIRMRCAKAPLRRTRGALPRKIAYGDICGDPGGALHQMLCEFEIRSLNKTVAKNRDLSCQTRKRPRTGARCTWSYISGRVKALDKAIRRIRRLQKTAIFRVRQGSASRTGRAVYLSYISGRAGGADAVSREIARFFRSRGHQAVSASSPPL